jgi:hypothetical protein
VVRLLIKRGARVTSAPGGGLYAAGWWEDLHVLRLLIDAGAPIDTDHDVTPFLACWCWKKFDAAKLLAARGADVNHQDATGKTALHHGVEKEFEPVLLKWLVKHGASPDIQDHDGVSPRLRASRKRDKRIHRRPRLIYWLRWTANRVAGRIDLPAPTPPDMRVRIRRFRSD